MYYMVPSKFSGWVGYFETCSLSFEDKLPLFTNVFFYSMEIRLFNLDYSSSCYSQCKTVFTMLYFCKTDTILADKVYS